MKRVSSPARMALSATSRSAAASASVAGEQQHLGDEADARRRPMSCAASTRARPVEEGVDVADAPDGAGDHVDDAPSARRRRPGGRARASTSSGRRARVAAARNVSA